VSTVTLHTVHDWSGVIATLGVVVHVVLHWRWITTMTRRLAADDGQAARRRVERSSAAAQPARIATPLPVGAAGEAVVASSSDDGDDRLSRRAFLVGLGAAAGATAFLGATALLRSDVSSAAGTQSGGTQSGSSGSSQPQSSGWGSGQGNGWQGGAPQGSGSSQSGGSSGSTTTAQRVVVDTGSCIGCGRCLSACPYGVFAWNGDGRTVTAQNPDACRLCGHCVQVCPHSAITLNA
jgi:NAD-dependent dihydropyrimidine dehydrogenase PreA subunit